MSINWVMLDPSKTKYTPLPSERTLWTSSPRTSLALTSPRTPNNTFPAHQSAATPVNITSNDGTLYLTNQRLIYLPKTSMPTFESFSAPLLNLHDTHIVMPWFGPNSWVALVQPVNGGNIPAGHAVIELKLTFKEGGAPDFQAKFEALKERLREVVDRARESNLSAARQSGSGVDADVLTNVHLDELPSYAASGRDRVASPGDELDSMSPVPQAEDQRSRLQSNDPAMSRRQEAPPDAPPGYEEAQSQSVQAELDRRLSQGRRDDDN